MRIKPIILIVLAAGRWRPSRKYPPSRATVGLRRNDADRAESALQIGRFRKRDPLFFGTHTRITGIYSVFTPLAVADITPSASYEKQPPKFLKPSLTLCCTFAVALLVLQAPGATINWNPATTISGNSDVSTLGTLDRAFSFARGDTTTGPFGPSTINGVTFVSFPTSNNPPSATMGNTTVTAVGGSNTVESFNGLAGDNYPFSPPVPPFSNLSAAYQLMLSTAVYNGSANSGGNLILTLKGLAPGQRYLVEVWVNDSRSNSTRTETVTAGNSVTLAYNSTQVNGGLGQFAIGTFVADNTGSQSINFDSPQMPNEASQINGFQLRAVPTVYTWSTTTTGFAWLNASHWTGNPGHYPGVDANSKSIADGASTDVAAFSSMAFAATIVGINFSPS